MLGATKAGKVAVATVVLFQSSPSFYAGCNASSTFSNAPTPLCFNPHPAFMLGATIIRLRAYDECRVSILTQLLCWVQLPLSSNVSIVAIVVSILTQLLCWVQRCRLQGNTTSRDTCFNPHPAFMLGATLID